MNAPRRRSLSMLAVGLVAACIALAAATAQPARGQANPLWADAGFGVRSEAPTPAVGDVGQLVPATVELPSPLQCGDVTVYDAEDLATLCSAATLAATPIVSPTCPQVVSGSVRLETDLLCVNTSGLIAGSDGTVIDLNGHTVRCIAEPAGYMGSCQRFGDDIGVDTNDFDNIHVFSHTPGGTINGFDIGVAIEPNSDAVKVKQLVVTGPTGGPTGNVRPADTVGIIAAGGDHCPGGDVRIGGGTSTGNDVSNHRIGIDLILTSCVYVGYNTTHDNRDWGVPNFRGLGILLQDASDNHIRSNVSFRNGDGDSLAVPDAGILIDARLTGIATDNMLVENESDENRGAGIATTRGAAGNDILNNVMLFNGPSPPFADAFSHPTSVNAWNENNRCLTQTAPQPPPGVCGPDEMPPPP